MNIAVIGMGYLGTQQANYLYGKHDIYEFDITPGKNRVVRRDLGSVSMPSSIEMKRWINHECEVAFVCVPTPIGDDGACDTSLVEGVLEWLITPTIVIRSTVPPGTTDRLGKLKPTQDVIFQPEFGGESKYWTPFKFDTDMKEMPYYVFGGERSACEKLVHIYTAISGPMKSYHITDTKTAEMVKYVTNSFGAMKVTFSNEMKDICDAYEIDWGEVRELWTNDPRVTKMHTAVFGDARGYGGKCFPKDVKALIAFARRANADSLIMEAVDRKNKQYRGNDE